jgi:hypothetical protein
MNIVGADEAHYNEDGSMQFTWVTDNGMRRRVTFSPEMVDVTARALLAAPVAQEGQHAARVWRARALRTIRTRDPNSTILEIAIGNTDDGTSAKFALPTHLRLELRDMLNQEPEAWGAPAGS